MVDFKSSQSLYFELSDDNKMPKIGFGTSRLIDNAEELVSEAIKAGFRHIDTATLYLNEEHVGRALKKNIDEGKVKREELFITTKLHENDKEDVEKALMTSLKKLQLDYVDLYLIHWPLGIVDRQTHQLKKQIPLHVTWKALEDQVRAGRIRSLGVSNFNVQLLLDLLSYAEFKPVCNQVEVHPYFIQEELVGFCQKFGVQITSYFPLGGNRSGTPVFNSKSLLAEPLFKELGSKYNKTPGQIVINWHISRGLIPIPRTTNKERIKENFEGAIFELEPEDVKKINSLNKNIRLCEPKVTDDYARIPLFN